MSAAQEISDLYTEVYCTYAACAILIYDWTLCLGQEVRFIWGWHSKVISSALVYALSRYALLVTNLLAVATNYPMSDLVCRANTSTQTAFQILGTIAFSAFSALRAYALSNRNKWLTTIIILLALPSIIMNLLQSFYQASVNQPSPFNCSLSTSLSPTLALRCNVVWRGSQLTAELLVVGITWWYSYQSYRMRKGINFGHTISSLLIYNGSLYFLFLATLYILEIIVDTTSIPVRIADVLVVLEAFYDPITSILVCRFILQLRQFDSSPASGRYSEAGSRVREHTASSDVLQFAAQPSESLPTFLTSFAHPVHVVSALSNSETDPDAIDDDGAGWQEMDVVAPTMSDDGILPESGS
ncbi:hypothetical protein LXA43DRAFT_671243 [Ganoderma leucocontextum]|nr:hypothetical protein LXA43DRAFT_671243 [Ganoderma leucocontextum]